VTETPESLAFLDALAALAGRLAADGITIYSVSYHTHAFGSWELEAGRRRARVRVTWEGKDRQLRVATAELASGSTARAWQFAEEHDYRSRRPDLAQMFGTVRAAIAAHTGA
jgi:hypothetical protein